MKNFDNTPQAHDKCAELARMLYEYVDGNGDAQTRARLAQHAEECPSCLEALGVEQQVREILRSSCCKPAPVELRSRITRQLRISTSESGTSITSVTTEYSESRFSDS